MKPSAAQPLRDLRDALAAAAVLCRVARALRRQAFPDLLARFGLGHRLPSASGEMVTRAQTAVRRAHRLLPLQPNCLLDSLAAATLVRRQGYSVPLAIGVKKESGTMLAHAWLGGQAPADGFRFLYRVPLED